MSKGGDIMVKKLPSWAISAGVTSVVPEELRVDVSIQNVANEEAVDLELQLKVRAIFANPELAENVKAETIIDGEIVEIPIEDGLIEFEDVELNTTIPLFLTFEEEDNYVITFQLIDSDTNTRLAEDRDIEIAVQNPLS